MVSGAPPTTTENGMKGTVNTMMHVKSGHVVAWAITCTVVWFTGCSLADTGLTGRGGSGEKTTEQKPKGDSEKPSDASEGIPGYLTDPDQVVFTRLPDGVTVKVDAKPATVASASGSPGSVRVSAWTIDDLAITSDQLGVSGSGAEATLSNRIFANEDGSFSTNIVTPVGQSLLIVVGLQPGVTDFSTVRPGDRLNLKGLDENTYVLNAGVSAPAGAILSLSAGADHVCALGANRQVHCWGSNVHGAAGVSVKQQVIIKPVKVNVSALTADGAKIVQVASGSYHTCALTNAGQAWCWGSNAGGALGNGSSELDDCGGGTQCTSTPRQVTLDHLPEGFKINALTSGSPHTCALSATGSVACWGDGTYGQLGNGTTSPSDIPVAVNLAATGESSLKRLAASSTGTCGVTKNDVLTCWGLDLDGELGNGSGAPDTCYSDGRPCALSPIVAVQTNMQGKPAFLAGATQGFCTVSDAGSLFCWGNNRAGKAGGQIGSPTFDLPTAVDVSGVPGIQFSSVASAFDHSCAIATDHSLYCWGSNRHGQLGQKTDPSESYDGAPASHLPLKVDLFGETPSQVVTGTGFTCALTAQGNVFCFGASDKGQTAKTEATDQRLPRLIGSAAFAD